MKKLILTFGLVIASQFGFSQTATATTTKTDAAKTTTAAPAIDDAFKKDLLKLIEKGEVGSQLSMYRDQLVKQIPAEKQAAFLVEFETSMSDLYQKLIPVYAEAYTKEDAKSILAFYDSPLGKKIAEKSKVINEKSQTVAQEWGQGLQSLMMKYMQ